MMERTVKRPGRLFVAEPQGWTFTGCPQQDCGSCPRWGFGCDGVWARELTDIEFLVQVLETVEFQAGVEAQLCAAVDQQLFVAGIWARREVPIGKGCRVDRLWRNIGIEVKVGRPDRRRTRRQVERYLRCDAISGLVLVTEFPAYLEDQIEGKPVHEVCVHHGRLAI